MQLHSPEKTRIERISGDECDEFYVGSGHRSFAVKLRCESVTRAAYVVQICPQVTVRF